MRELKFKSVPHDGTLLTQNINLKSKSKFISVKRRPTTAYLRRLAAFKTQGYYFGTCVRRRASITRRGRRRSEGGGVRFTVSSAARRLTNYLWNCCIHSHLNRNLSGGERSAPRREQRGEQPAGPAGESHPSPWPLRPPPSVLYFPLRSPPHSSASRPIASPTSLSLQPRWWIEPNANLQPFHMSMPPPDRLQEHSSTSCFQDVLPDASAIIGLLSISRLHTSSAEWRLMSPRVPPAAFCPSPRVRACAWAVLVHILQKVIPARWIPGWRKPLLLLFDLHGSALCMVMGFQSAGCRLRVARDVSPPNVVVHHPPGWRDGGKKAKGKERSQFFTLSAQRGNVVPL